MEKIYDCIVIGAGPGGLSAGIYLGRAHRKTLLINCGLMRTGLAMHISNYLGFDSISGSELIERGLEQVRRFGVEVMQDRVKKVERKGETFKVITEKSEFLSNSVIAASGVLDILPEIENLSDFLGETFFTCTDCDGYRMTGKKSIIIGRNKDISGIAKSIKNTYTDRIVVVCEDIDEENKKELQKEKIRVTRKKISSIKGENGIATGVLFEDGSEEDCECILSRLGYERNDSYLAELRLERNEKNQILVNDDLESSIKNLFVLGPLNQHGDQASVAAGEGARVAMKIKKAG